MNSPRSMQTWFGYYRIGTVGAQMCRDLLRDNALTGLDSAGAILSALILIALNAWLLTESFEDSIAGLDVFDIVIISMGAVTVVILASL